MSITPARRSLALLIVVAVAACSAPTTAVLPRLGRLDVDGDIGFQAGSSVQATNSVDALGLEDDSSAGQLRVDLDFGAPKFTFLASQSSHDGTGRAEADISTGGVVINANDRVATDFELGVYSASLTWDLLPDDAFELALGVGATALDVSAKFTDLDTPATVSTDETLPLPLLVARAGVRVWRIDVSGLLNWMDLTYSGDRTSVLDLDAMASLRLLGEHDSLAGYIAIGYRLLGLDVSYEDANDSAELDMNFQGPWIGLAVSI